MRRATKPHMEFNWPATTGMKRRGSYDLEKNGFRLALIRRTRAERNAKSLGTSNRRKVHSSKILSTTNSSYKIIETILLFLRFLIFSCTFEIR